MIDQEEVFQVLCVVVLVIAAYVYIFPDYPDTAPVLLDTQASVAPMRKSGETAVYRNVLVGQMGELIQGIGIQDSNGRPRNGDISDIWKVFQQNNSALAVAAYSPENCAYGLEKTSANEASSLVQAVGSQLAKMCGSGTLAILAPNCLETFICCISAMIFNVPVVIVPLTLEEPHIVSAVQKMAPKVVLSTQEIVEELGIGNEVTLVSLKGRTGVTFASLADSSSELLDISVYDPSKAQFPVSHVYLNSDKSKVEIAQFTMDNIAAAIAAQIQALPRNDQWSSKDSVFSCSSYVSLFELVLQLSGLVAGSTVIFPQLNTPIDLFNLVKAIKPTIIISDDRTSASLASRSERLKLLSMLRLQISNASLSRGQIPKYSAALGSIFSSVRLIHTAVDANSEEPLTTHQANTIRALTGTRVVHALTAPISASPIAETNIYDYRLRDADTVINYGALLPCLEAKLKDHGEYDAASKKGQLYVRGTTTTGPATEWINTGVVATWGVDGTLRLFI